MEYYRNDMKAGLLILVACFVAGLFIFKVGDFQLFNATQHVRIAFVVANGLERESPVMYAGVPVGEVLDIEILSEHEIKPEHSYARIVFTVSLDKGIVVKTDSEASIKTLGLMGEKYIEISPGSVEASPLKPEQILLGKMPFDLDQLLVSGQSIMNKVDTMLDHLGDLLNDETMIASLKKTVKNFEQLTQDAKDMVGENREDLRRLMQNLAQATDGLKDKLDTTIANLDGLLTNADGMIDDNRENVRIMVSQFKDASIDFASFAEKIDAHPWMLLKKSPEEIEAERKNKKR